MKRRNSWLGLALLVLLLVAGGRALWLWLDRPIERVSIRGDWDYVNAEYLRTQLAPLVSNTTWLSADLGKLRDDALDIGWLHEVRLSREWPDTLVFELVEQRPVARWNDRYLLNDQGVPFVFAPMAAPDGLPDLSGPEGSSQEVLSYYQNLLPEFASLALSLNQLRLEPRGAWRLQFDNDMWVMLGRQQHEIRLARLMSSWQRELKRFKGDIRYIHLRYPNGVAVSWHGYEDYERLAQ